MSRRDRAHDHDAGGPPEVLARKRALREDTWTLLNDRGAARFPGAEERIPNFVGAEAAAERLRATDEWQRAGTLKANPDSPQWPVRQRALEDGKLVFMAVPKLADRRPFFVLDPQRLRGSARAASSIRGASAAGRTVDPAHMTAVDMVVCGSVAVSPDGARLGKGGGFSDLEFAIALEAGLVSPDTVIVTTVHDLQLADTGTIPMTNHDVPVDIIVTPERTIRCEHRHPRPSGVHWDELTEEKIAAIPILAALSKRRHQWPHAR